MIWHLIAVGCGGFIGALLRFEVSAKLNRDRFPYGTLVVNSIGSFFIGWIIGSNLSIGWTLFLATGVAGALTTYSTLMKEIWTYWTKGQKLQAVGYTLVTFIVGIGLAFLGLSL
ncbi:MULTISPECIES: CrcB family protein [unclassified Sporosarcina]|uniref:fluoride efflux transporter FluC n=1 Tax=unclassified Sporosarcina TaxID=2647733 RepID=UPI000C168960|nr:MULTISPECIES: CrcB family protein [unclassified Sporosarcina]PID00977.1 fluoride efflux transporter CrcB [Sporosarcina sp. P29]PID04916.1 fluoride efflux transporter CrcB [Sporosarcina sp. P30]PID08176.1 fluoride efflux transporter CrcB [Sporosarcina sp. P31]PID11256.1 fluoride efflux transporter CrcB [Sporosarcina sp. P32b]